MPRFLLRVIVEEEIDAEDEEQAQEILFDLFQQCSWHLAEVERLEDDKQD